MIHTKETLLSKDIANKRIIVTRSFVAPPDVVWRAWTEAELLDKWWAPRPYRAETRTMDFRNGGYWLYAMVSPVGERTWNKFTYSEIEFQKTFKHYTIFCDENGIENPEMPSGNWKCSFYPTDEGTTVEVELFFNSIEGLKMILEMGFKEGFSMAHGNLDELLNNLKK